jgi:glycerol-3-phosphate dehydrogenase
VVFPAIDKYRMSRTYVGIRPTLWAWAKNEDRLSREHEFYDHAPQGVPGLISVAGGKLASYRQLAEEVTAEIAKRVGNTEACTTHSAPLPGAEEAIDVDAWMKDLPKRHRLAISRMAYRHGSRSKKILAVVTAPHEDGGDPRQVVSTCLCEPVCEAELRACIKGELVRRLVDVRRRTRQSMGACGGTRCAARTSQLLLEEAALTPAEQLVELQGAMRARFIGKRPVLEGANLATEELNQAMHFLAGNLGPFFQAARVACDDVAHRRPESAPADAPVTRVSASQAPGVIVPAPLPEDRR